MWRQPCRLRHSRPVIVKCIYTYPDETTGETVCLGRKIDGLWFEVKSDRGDIDGELFKVIGWTELA